MRVFFRYPDDYDKFLECLEILLPRRGGWTLAEELLGGLPIKDPKEAAAILNACELAGGTVIKEEYDCDL